MAEVDDGSGEVDLLSQFPDEILSHVLSFLELDEAVRLKLLSHRWEHLWPANPTLSFARFECHSCYSLSCQEYEDHRHNFVARVDKFMQQFRAPKIEAFELSTTYDLTDCAYVIDEWIRLAFLMKPERIRFLHLHTRGSYTFPLHLLHAAGSSNLRDLKIDGCRLPPFSSLSGPIISLRTLSFYSVAFHDTSEGIASYIPNLETLHISCYDQFTSMRQLGDLCRQFIYLKSLHIWIPQSIGPEIPNNNLTNFTSVGEKWLFFKGLEGLQHLYISANFSLKYAVDFLPNIPEEFPQLIGLSISGLSMAIRLPSFITRFKCLKYLALSVNSSLETLQYLLKLLQGAPILQVFRINLMGNFEQWSAAWLEEHLLRQHVMQDAYEMHHVHSHIRKIHIVNPYFGKNEVEIIIMLLKYATSLMKMNFIGFNVEHLKELQSALARYFPRVNFTTNVL